MPLVVVSTPIGNPKDISQHALEAIEQAELVIGEEKKQTLRLLKLFKLTGRPVELLNEHSDEQDLDFYLQACKEKQVALVSDCGTPGFCDPGANLVDLCHKNNIEVTVAPGASSLMALLAVAGHRLDQFFFRGFIPANNEKRSKAYMELKKTKIPIVLMDTPYRLAKTMDEMAEHFSSREIIVGYRLTFPEHQVFRGKPKQVKTQMQGLKGEFILVII